MQGAQDNGGSTSARRYRWMFVFAVGGDLRFISHHDTLRFFRRALARANLPVRFSEGFNPHPRINLPLPRPVGVASDAEAMVVEFERPVDPDEALRRIAEHTPAEIRMIRVEPLGPNDRPQPEWVRYRLDAGRPPPPDLPARARDILASDVVPVERVIPKSGRKRSLNIRPYIVELRVDGSSVDFTIRVTGSGAARPSEIAALLGFDAGSINHRIRRVEVQWRQT